MLSLHAAVAAAAVVAPDGPPGDRGLHAFVVPRSGAGPVDGGELRRFLAERLPAPMVPAVCTVVDALPLTANGKLDRGALRARAPVDHPPAVLGERPPDEERVAAIWAGVLGLDAGAIGSGDDFFELGGHSLLATQVVARIREEFGTETPLRTIFDAPTLAALAVAVAADRRTGRSSPASRPLRPRPPDAVVPLSLAQEQMWALEAAATPAGLYNFTVIHRFAGPVDEPALRAALAAMVRRHEILRTRFAVVGGEARQVVAASAEVDIDLVDLGPDPADAEWQSRIAEHEAAPFDPARPPLFRVGLFRVDGGSSRLAVTFDHLISDGTGAALFLDELLVAYDAASHRRPAALPALPVQFGDFAVWQRSSLTDDALRRQLDWWVEALDGMPLGPVVPVDRRPDTPTRRIGTEVVAVDAATRTGLENVARDTGSTVFAATVAAAAAVFGAEGRSSDVVLSTTLNGRTRAELEGMVGMFSGVGRIRIDLGGDPPFAVVVARARDWVLGMFEHQDVPFLRVRRAVLPDFPTGGVAVAAALPVEFQYFHAPVDHEFLFRGQLHPLSLTLRDSGREITGTLRYKVDFYEPATVARLADRLDRVLRAVAADAWPRLSELDVNAPAPR